MPIPQPSIPNFNVETPNVDPLGQQMRMVALKDMLAKQALIPLQEQEMQQRIQSEKLQNEMNEMMLQGRRGMAEYFQNIDKYSDVPTKDFSQNTQVASYLGISPNDQLMDVARGMAKANVPLPMVITELQGALQRRQEYYKGTKEQQDATASDYKMWRETLAPIVDEKDQLKRSVLLAEAMPTLEAATKATPVLGQLAEGLRGHPEFIDSASTMVGAQQAALGIGKAKAEKKAAEQKVIPEGGGLSAEAQQDIEKQNTPFSQWRKQFVKEVGREPNTKEIQAFQTAGQAMRLEGFLRPVYDTENNITVWKSPEELRSAPAGRFTDPTYTPEAQIARGAGTAFAPGGVAGKELKAFNTAFQHADLLSQAAGALDNSDVKALNTAKNALRTQFGSADVTNYSTIAKVYEHEVLKALGGHVTDAEVKSAGAMIPDNASPAQIKGAVQNLKNLMQSKIGVLRQQYEAAKGGQPAFPAPAGLQVGQEVSIHGKKMKVTAVHPDGSFDAQ